MTDTMADEAKISIKVIVDKVEEIAVCAEADHRFVDILFSFMTLPMGTIVRLLGKLDDKKFERRGSLNNLYQSLKDFPECYFSTEEFKHMLLNPRSLAYDYCRHLELKIDDTERIQYFVCNGISSNLMRCNSMSPKVNGSKYCQRCGKLMDLKESYWYADVCVRGGVFVSNNATFIITDDLRVEPYSSARIIQLLTDRGVTNMNYLEERNLEMSTHQVN
ncbi:hypothetical protein HanPI659440_Chr09g0318251 [Helianthus annuus]|nr:hypothetical protein HanPI659440_Chr09g0318251 [Helianthus annuus]